MKKQINMENGIIEYILSALDTAEQDIPSDLPVDCEVKKFMDGIPGGFFIYHADGDEQLIYANRSMLRIFNCETLQEFRELTGNSFRGIVHPEDLEAVEKSIWEQIAHSQYDLDYVEYRIIQKGGQIRWIEDYGHFLHSETIGDVFYVFAADATEKRNRIQEEKESFVNGIQQEYLRRLEIIEGLSVNYESIQYADLDTDRLRPYRLSERTEHQMDKEFEVYSLSRFITDYVRTWVFPDDRSLVTQTISPSSLRKRLADTASFYINYRVLMDGESQYLQLRIARVGNKNPISRIVMGARRVDDEIRHEMEQKLILEDALRQVKFANAAKTSFLSNMSHDILTPLNAIIGYTALARNHLSDLDKASEYLTKIENSSGLLLHLISDVLEISRIESGNMQIEEEPFLLDSLLQELKAAALPKAEAKQISFSVHDAGIRHRKVCADQQKLMQILMHLVSNAIKYTKKNGTVRILVSEPEDSPNDYAIYQFEVEDNGIGISPEAQKHIFEPFERVKNTTLSGVIGTGLGLTIARNLAEMLGGTISLKSTLQKGSTFTLTMGLRLPEDAVSGLDQGNSAAGMLNGRKILLAEDNEINREIEVELLQEQGFFIDTAENGKIAVDMIAASDPGDYALVLMDIQMPVMDGHEATRAIRRLPDPALSRIPIVALSANSFEEDRKQSRESGMNAHLAKPVNLPELLELIAGITRQEGG